MKVMKYPLWLLLLVPLLFVQGCGGNRYAEDVQNRYSDVSRQIADLKQSLDQGRLTNAVLARTYANALIKINPDLEPIATLMKRDAGSSGTLFKNFEKRLAAVNRSPVNEAEYRSSLEELNSLNIGADTVVFNDALLDIVNTLADLSQGKLARINVPKSDAAENVKGIVPGSYLVGNPNYGSWKTDSSGSSFWAFYGQYAMFRDIMGMGFGRGYYRGSIYANDWYSRPRYSYYDNYGRGSYGSQQARESWKNTRADLKKNGITPAKPKKDFRSTAGKQRASSYSSYSKKQYGAKTSSPSRAPPSSSSSNRQSNYSMFKPSSRGTSSGTRSTRSGK